MSEPSTPTDTRPSLAEQAKRREQIAAARERIAAVHADWRRRWPAVFTTPVPLAIGISRQIREALGPEYIGKSRDMYLGMRHWTARNSYLRAIRRGEMRRNLDGSEAGIPTEANREHARMVLADRDKKALAREQRVRERQQL